ncbi:flagellar hook-associated protein FlgL [uncultured Umboniibacter sp.]|uniref:flagellar hook-associated protein FlgL n=1 Tax=uncultured Umboniibacter sp. TaxID=1798917 RepID=UPI00263288BC|nr:flagellar hook-associated protein FlgL [uncultured Umboniibacter sp.]
MRVADSQVRTLMQQSLQTSNTELAKVMQQISTGKRLTKISDDPSASLKLESIRSEQEELTQYQSNIETAKTALAQSEQFLSSTNDTLLRIKDLVLFANNGTRSPDDLKGISIELENLRDSLITQFNARDGSGSYLFSGTYSDQPAIVAGTNPNEYVVQGNSSTRETLVGRGIRIETNVTAQAMIGSGANTLTELSAFISDLAVGSVNSSSASSSLDAVDSIFSEVQKSITTLGGRQSFLNTHSDNIARNKLFLDKVSTEISSLDMSEASTRLQSYLQGLEASHLTFKRISELNLFNLM